MTTGLLQTKLHAPPPRPNLVARPRMLARLDEGVARQRRLALVVAPAGYGKTTLVTSWLATLPPETAVGWLSLDGHDNEPLRFIRYLVAAVRDPFPGFAPGLGESVGATTSTPGPPDVQAISHALTNALHSIDERLLLVLDDYHAIDNADVQQLVADLIDYAPPAVQFVLTARDLPPLPVPRWRVRDQVTTITADDLRFNAAEAGLFLHETMGLTLDETAVAELEQRTEGWVAGLQLAAISLRREDGQTAAYSLSGSDRFVADYLLTEVLDHQTADIHTFLLQTSLFDRFSADLGDAVLQRSDSRALLDDLERSDLFLVPLDNERRWYRYHHLFGELLQDRLRREADGAAIDALNSRAARWFDAHGFREEAVQHALAAGDRELAAALIAATPSHVLWQQDGAYQLAAWVEALPEAVRRAEPRTLLLAAGANLLLGRVDDLRRYMAQMEGVESLWPAYLLFQSVLVRNSGQPQAALELLKESLAGMEEEADPVLQAMARLQLAVNNLELGRWNEAEAEIEATRTLLRPGSPAAVMNLEVLRLAGMVAFARGDTYAAERIWRDALALTTAPDGTISPTTGVIQADLASIQYEWNELAAAEALYEEALQSYALTGLSDTMFSAELGLADLAAMRGDGVATDAHLTRVRQFVQKSGLGSVIEQLAAVQVLYDLRLNRLDAAVRWANASGHSADERPAQSDARSRLALLATRLAESRALGTTDGVADWLAYGEHLLGLAESAGHVTQAIRLRLQLAQGYVLLGDEERALDNMTAALAAAERGSLTRTFLDAGPGVQVLLEAAEARNIQPRPVRRLLLAFARETGHAPTVAPAALPEPLTDREYEVLRLIAAGLSNREIEERLVITNNTVRSHIKNLYGKLGVGSRTQAVQRAQILGLL